MFQLLLLQDRKKTNRKITSYSLLRLLLLPLFVYSFLNISLDVRTRDPAFLNRGMPQSEEYSKHLMVYLRHTSPHLLVADDVSVL